MSEIAFKPMSANGNTNTLPKSSNLGCYYPVFEFIINNQATGSPTATCQVQGSVAQNAWANVGSSTVLTGAGGTGITNATVGSNYQYYRVNITAIGGTGTTVYCYMSN